MPRIPKHWLRAGACVLPAVTGLCNGTPLYASTGIAWDAPETCPGAGAVAERLRALLGEDVAVLDQRMRVRGVVGREGAGYRVVLEVAEGGRRSSRSLVADDCADLTEAATLAIALTVHAEQQPAASATPARDTGSAAPLTSLPPAKPSPIDSSSAEVPRVNGDLRWSVGVEGVVDTSALPAAAPGVSLDARVRWGAPSLDVHALYLPLQALDVSRIDQVEFGLMLLGARGCYQFLDGSPRAAACAGIEAGRFEAVGKTLDSARQVRDLWLAPSASLEGRQPLVSGWQLVFRGEALAPLERKQYVVNENDGVHTPARLDLRLSLGLSVGTD